MTAETFVVAGTNKVHIEVLPPPLGPDATADHLVRRHGLSRTVIAGLDPTALHEAEHRTRDPEPSAKGNRHAGHLTHTHRSPKP